MIITSIVFFVFFFFLSVVFSSVFLQEWFWEIARFVFEYPVNASNKHAPSMHMWPSTVRWVADGRARRGNDTVPHNAKEKKRTGTLDGRKKDKQAGR